MFWTGLMLLLLFAVVVPVVPTGGFYNDAISHTGFSYVLDVAHHLVLPAVTLALIYLALYTRLARAAMLEIMDSDYVRTARAKGLSEPKVLFKHALRNALLPVVTFAGLQLSGMFAGSVLVETVFTWPGLGLLAYDSIIRRDKPANPRYSNRIGSARDHRQCADRHGLPTGRSAHQEQRLMSDAMPTTTALSMSQTRARSPWLEAWLVFRQNRAALIGLVLLTFIVLFVLIGPRVYHVDPFEIVQAPHQPPGSEDVPLGSDYLGRDILAGLIQGGRPTLLVGTTAAMIAAVLIGVTIGALSGYFGRKVDSVLRQVIEFFQVLPALLFTMVVVTLFGSRSSTVAIAIGVVAWTGMARLDTRRIHAGSSSSITLLLRA